MPENVNLREQLELLAKLQKRDSELFDIETKLKTFPEKIKEIENSIESKMTSLNEAEEKLKRLLVSKNEKETEIQAKEEKILKHQGDLYQIKTNKEYTALQSEINNIRADSSLLEEALINIFDAIEAGQADCKKQKTLFENEKVLTEKEKQSMQQEEKDMAEKANEVKAKKSELSQKIIPDVLSKYERILKNRGRAALAWIKDGCCGECNIQLRPQVINEAKIKKELIFCENCARILYAED
ncbi:MAG: C4-type zinc ribbon domain-containing protein [Candidatus Omnitrophota bacterium]